MIMTCLYGDLSFLWSIRKDSEKFKIESDSLVLVLLELNRLANLDTYVGRPCLVKLSLPSKVLLNTS